MNVVLVGSNHANKAPSGSMATIDFLGFKPNTGFTLLTSSFSRSGLFSSSSFSSGASGTSGMTDRSSSGQFQ